jgi:hypothetical protein
MGLPIGDRIDTVTRECAHGVGMMPERRRLRVPFAAACELREWLSTSS